MATARAAVVVSHKISSSGDHVFRVAFWIDTPANLVALIPLSLDTPDGVLVSSVATVVADATTAEKNAITSGAVLEFLFDTGQVPDSVNANQLANFLMNLRTKIIAAVTARSNQQANAKNNAVGKTLDLAGAWTTAVTV